MEQEDKNKRRNNLVVFGITLEDMPQVKLKEMMENTIKE